jgi:hypothetical protein
MRNDLSDRLMKRCPIIYRGALPGPNRIVMHFGFECSSGWFEMILLLSEAIERIAVELKSEGVEESKLPMVCQVKQKFGGLRYYMENGNKEIYAMIEEAQTKSFHICEICGAYGERVIIGGFYTARCNEHTRSDLGD